MTNIEYQDERRQLKQKLFHIRRYVEGEPVKLDTELRELKKKYEKLPNFTSWSGFPELWDIGDPHRVKLNSYAFDESDVENFKRAFDKPYETIVHKTSGRKK